MAAGKKRAAEIQAGIVVLLGLTVIGLSLFWVSGGSDQFKAKTVYTIYLPNAAGLKEGYETRLDGRRVGKVKTVRAALDSERPAEIGGRKYGNFAVVEAEIYAQEKVPEDTIVEVSKSITGTVTLLMYSGESGTFATDKTILSGRARADFEKATDAAVALVKEAENMVREATEVVREVREEVDALQMEGLRDQADSFLTKLNRLADRLDKFVATNEGPATELVESARAAMVSIRQLSDDLPKDWRDDLKPKVGNALDEVTGLVKDAREPLRLVMQKLDDAVTLAQETLVSLNDLSQTLKGTVVEAKPHLLATLRSARTGMANFQDAAADLKSSPWKLLKDVDKDEIEAVYFFDAAKRYMEAAREVRSSVDDLKAMKATEGPAFEDAKKRLEEAVAKMREQEDAIQKALKSGG